MILSKSVGGVLTGVFVGVFGAAFAVELARRAGVGRKIADGYAAAKEAFLEGYRSADQEGEPAELPGSESLV